LDYSKVGSSLPSEQPDRMDKSIYSQGYDAFLRRLRAARVRAGVTQEELARRLGRKQSFVSKCERGERRLDVVEARAFCVALGVSFPRFVAALDKEAAGWDRSPSEP
jgi:transcriptional regulator with XRE-family HTH domain